MRATAYRMLEQPDLAKDNVEMALKADPNDPDALLERGTQRAQAGDKAGAREDWIRTIEIAPDTPAAEDARKGLAASPLHAGEVLVVRGEGPRGSPGMREMLDVVMSVRRQGIGAEVAMVTDGRWPTGSGGLCVAHVSPEAHAGGPLAVVRNGDMIRIDADRGSVDLLLGDDEIARRCSQLAPVPCWSGGLGEKYARVVGPTHLGAPTHSYSHYPARAQAS